MKKKSIFWLSVAITLFLFSSMLMLGSFMDSQREKIVKSQFNRMYKDMLSLQIISLIDDSDKELQCIAFKEKMKELDEYIWDLGKKIDEYRIATEEFQKDPFYKEQKMLFNENEIIYYLIMKRFVEKCSLKKQILLFFYRNSKDCKKCDDQSFVLTELSLDDDKLGNNIAIFSFDLDLNLTTVNILADYYNIKTPPCIVFSDNNTKCGIMGKKEIIDEICKDHSYPICKNSKKIEKDAQTNSNDTTKNSNDISGSNDLSRNTGIKQDTTENKTENKAENSKPENLLENNKNNTGSLEI